VNSFSVTFRRRWTRGKIGLSSRSSVVIPLNNNPYNPGHTRVIPGNRIHVILHWKLDTGFACDPTADAIVQVLDEAYTKYENNSTIGTNFCSTGHCLRLYSSPSSRPFVLFIVGFMFTIFHEPVSNTLIRISSALSVGDLLFERSCKDCQNDKFIRYKTVISHLLFTL
jgi:hypothetical protein